MKNRSVLVMAFLAAVVLFFIKCGNQGQDTATIREQLLKEFRKNSVYDNPEKYGEHLVTIMGCNDCHTPKRMGKFGPEQDSVLMLSGHPAKMPLFDIDRKAMAAKGLIVTSDLTAWAGPWGVSYTANLTPHETGLANWTLDQFQIAIRHGKFHGIENGRNLLPPMPWDTYKYASDDEIAAVFAYLKTIKPINNLVPPPLPPAQ
jgi:hypothetical protein